MSQEEIQQRYLELQILEQQIQHLQQQAQVLQHQLQELTSLNESIEQLSKVKEGSDMLIPLGAGVYAKGELKNNKELIMNVGASVTIEKSVPESAKIITEQISHVEKLLEQLSSELEKATSTAQNIQSSLISKN